MASVVKMPTTTSQSVAVAEMVVVVVVLSGGSVVVGATVVVGGTNTVVVVVVSGVESPPELQAVTNRASTNEVAPSTNNFVFGTATPSSGSGAFPTRLVDEHRPRPHVRSVTRYDSSAALIFVKVA